MILGPSFFQASRFVEIKVIHATYMIECVTVRPMIACVMYSSVTCVVKLRPNMFFKTTPIKSFQDRAVEGLILFPNKLGS